MSSPQAAASRLRPRLHRLGRHQHARRDRAPPRALRGLRADGAQPRRRTAGAMPAVEARASRPCPTRLAARALRDGCKQAGLRTEVLSGREALERTGGAPGCRRGDGGHRRRRRPGRLPGRRAGRQAAAAGQQGGAGGRRRAVHARGARGRRHAAADRQRAFGDLPVPARRPRHLGRAHRPHRAHRLGRAVPHPRPGHVARRDAGPGLRAPELGDGAQDLGRLGDHDEQGARGHRGALAVRRWSPSRSAS